jgi:hypothetical protein
VLLPPPPPLLLLLLLLPGMPLWSLCSSASSACACVPPGCVGGWGCLKSWVHSWLVSELAMAFMAL